MLLIDSSLAKICTIQGSDGQSHKLNTIDKFIYQYLANSILGNESVSEKGISYDLGVSLGTVNNCIKKLVKVGFISKDRVKHKGQWKGTTYKVYDFLSLEGVKYFNLKGEQL
ncbi:hypothetical protein VPHF99_0149 [Vibrio phage F99]|nr:hypothetical protein MYOV085v1_p0001 [Vibrio phage 355E48.1]